MPHLTSLAASVGPTPAKDSQELDSSVVLSGGKLNNNRKIEVLRIGYRLNRLGLNL